MLVGDALLMNRHFSRMIARERASGRAVTHRMTRHTSVTEVIGHPAAKGGVNVSDFVTFKKIWKLSDACDMRCHLVWFFALTFLRGLPSFSFNVQETKFHRMAGYARRFFVFVAFLYISLSVRSGASSSSRHHNSHHRY